LDDSVCVLWSTKVLRFKAEAEIFKKGDINKINPDLETTEYTLSSIESKKSIVDAIIWKQQWWSGPLYYLYTSLLSMANISYYGLWGAKWLITANLEFFMKFVIGIMLILPLLAFVLVVIARWILLWLIAAFLPLLVIMWVFDFVKFGDKSNKFSIHAILGLIFLPVVAVFSLGISIVFLNLVNWLLIDKPKWVKVSEFKISNKDIQVDDNKIKASCFDMLWLTEACIVNSWKGEFSFSPLANIFVWLIVNFFGIAVMWAIVFASLKTSSLTASISGWIQALWKSIFETKYANIIFIEAVIIKKYSSFFFI